MVIFLYNIFISITYFICWIIYWIGTGGRSQFWQGKLKAVSHSGECDLWIHASSMGEIKVIGFLVDELIKLNPKIEIHLTAWTKTGYNEAKKLYIDKINQLSYLPIDYKPVAKKMIENINPKVIAIAETEIWPNMISQVHLKNIPVVLVNGRMSKKSFGKYKLIRKTLGRLLATYDKLFVKTDEDLKRYNYFNQNKNIEVAGDMKTDAPLVMRTEQQRTELCTKYDLDQNKQWLVGGSTRPGEEGILLDTFERLKSEFDNLGLILVPRHLKRINEISAMIDFYKFEKRLLNDKNDQADIILVNEMGHLEYLYRIADISFVGGTLADIGGHNLWEPVKVGSPLLFGPSLYNVADAAETIISKNFGMKINNQEQLEKSIKEYLKGELKFSTMTENISSNSPTKKIAWYISGLIKNA